MTKYDHYEYSGGYLSNDGSLFSVVDCWFYRNTPYLKIETVKGNKYIFTQCKKSKPE